MPIARTPVSRRRRTRGKRQPFRSRRDRPGTSRGTCCTPNTEAHEPCVWNGRDRRRWARHRHTPRTVPPALPSCGRCPVGPHRTSCAGDSASHPRCARPTLEYGGCDTACSSPSPRRPRAETPPGSPGSAARESPAVGRESPQPFDAVIHLAQSRVAVEAEQSTHHARPVIMIDVESLAFGPAHGAAPLLNARHEIDLIRRDPVAPLEQVTAPAVAAAIRPHTNRVARPAVGGATIFRRAVRRECFEAQYLTAIGTTFHATTSSRMCA